MPGVSSKLHWLGGRSALSAGQGADSTRPTTFDCAGSSQSENHSPALMYMPARPSTKLFAAPVQSHVMASGGAYLASARMNPSPAAARSSLMAGGLSRPKNEPPCAHTHVAAP